MPIVRERGGISFMQLLKSDFALRGGDYLKLALAILGCFLAVDVIVSIFTINRLNSVENQLYAHSYIVKGSKIDDSFGYIRANGMQIITFACILIISIGSTVIGSLTFSSMSDKRKRIATLMLPASIPQKFWLRFLIYTVGGTLLMIAGVALSNLIAQLAFGGWPYGNVWEGITYLYNDEHVGLRIIPILIALVMYGYTGNSIYALGSAFWPRLSWLKTWIVLMLFQWVVMIIMIFGAFSNLDIEGFLKFIIGIGGDVWLWVIVVSLALFNVGCWGVAYWRFRNTQIVQRFMKK